MQGNPQAEWASQRNDYVKIVSNGRVLNRNSNPIIEKDGTKTASLEEAHIPLRDWLTWQKWNEK